MANAIWPPYFLGTRCHQMQLIRSKFIVTYVVFCDPVEMDKWALTGHGWFRYVTSTPRSSINGGIYATIRSKNLVCSSEWFQDEHQQVYVCVLTFATYHFFFFFSLLLGALNNHRHHPFWITLLSVQQNSVVNLWLD